MAERPIGIDLFAGAGGMSLGFEQAGFDIVAAVEIDPIHANVHHFNFQETVLIPRSIIGLTGKEIRRLAGIGQKPIDTIFGGPPCQGFSLIGHRMLNDSRNLLVKEFVRVVRELKPRTFVFENVKGLTVGKHRMFLDSLIEAFEAEGYRIRLPWQVLNAKNFDVPQDRQRLFLLGARKDCRLPEYPEIVTNDQPNLLGKNGIRPIPTCFDAISDLPNAEKYPELINYDSVLCSNWSPATEYSKIMHCFEKGSWFFGHVRKWQPNLLTASMRTDHSDISRKRFSATMEGQVEPISRFFKLSRKDVCNTLRAGTDSARGAFTSPRPIHYKYKRCITVREMARLHGYPDWFRFHITKWHGARQVGNSVPPPLARAVASEIIRSLGIEPNRNNRKVELGGPELLSMNMSEAADHWKISIPIRKRDRKNGLHKKKQSKQ